MQPRLFLLFSHALTGEQTRDARESFGVDEVVPLPKALQQRWSNVPPQPETIQDHLQPILEWLRSEARRGDYALIQGDFGAVYLTVNAARQWGLTPLYATTERSVKEVRLPGGGVESTRVFRHVRYRCYE